ncbi:MAG: hypothetical protein ABW185_17025, partial [Sedimenticola sp.]
EPVRRKLRAIPEVNPVAAAVRSSRHLGHVTRTDEWDARDDQEGGELSGHLERVRSKIQTNI